MYINKILHIKFDLLPSILLYERNNKILAPKLGANLHPRSGGFGRLVLEPADPVCIVQGLQGEEEHVFPANLFADLHRY